MSAITVAGAQGAPGCGGLQRKAPSGGAANGMPKNVQDDPVAVPCTSPFAVVTRHETDCGVTSTLDTAKAINTAEIKALAVWSSLRMGVLTPTWRKGVAKGATF